MRIVPDIVKDCLIKRKGTREKGQDEGGAKVGDTNENGQLNWPLCVLCSCLKIHAQGSV